jgi:hypothetical protein
MFCRSGHYQQEKEGSTCQPLVKNPEKGLTLARIAERKSL